MRRAAALFLTLTFATPILAEGDAHTLALEYANLPEVQMMWDDMFSPSALAEQFRSGVPANVEIAEDKLARIGEVMSLEMNKLRPEMTELIIEGMAQEFSADELTALITFYQSQHGASVMAKMQPFMAGILTRMAPRMQETQQAMLPEIIAIIEE